MRLLPIVPLLAVTFGAGPVNLAHAQEPDFSSVDDILLGRRSVLPIRDLVVSGQSQNLILQTENSSISAEDSYGTDGIPVVIGSGRMFDLPNDVIVTLVANSGGSSLNVRDPVGGRSLQINLSIANPNELALGDLNSDGYDEVVISYIDAGLQVASAEDVTSFTEGLVFGDVFPGSSTNPVGNPRAFAVGDLNRDGKGELAVIGLPTFQIYQLVPPTDPNNPSLDLELATSTPFNPSDASSVPWALHAGQFDDSLQDGELVVTYDDGGEIAHILVQVDDDLSATIGTPLANDQAKVPFAQAVGRLDWFGDTDQVVLFAASGPGNNPNLFVAESLDGSIGFVTSTTVFAGGCSFPSSSTQVGGVALGDFDFDLQNPESTPPDLEIALLVGCGDEGSTAFFEVQIFDVDPSNNFALSLVSETFPNQQPTGQADGNTPFVASDTQGRSLLLGPPTKVTMNEHSQPRIVMGSPPMHIDYVQDPAGSSADFGKVNMTAFPATDRTSDRGMNSEFEIASSSTVQNQSTHSTSYSTSVSDTTEASISFGVPDIDEVSASIKTTAKTTHDNLVQNKFGTYSGSSYEIDTITGFGDVVWFDTTRFNIWIYRVLGHLACPSDDTGCDTQLPLYMTFSGPDQISANPHTPGTAVEWYQPYHEAGNILSYPQTLAQLEDTLDAGIGFQPFFDLPFTTGNSADTETLTWSEGQSEAQTSGSVTTHSRTRTESVSASGYLDDIGIGASGSGSFTENSSESFGTLNTSSQTMAATDGFTVSVPGFNEGETYSYPFHGYIMGDAADPDVLQQELLDELQGEVDQIVNGTLRLAFTAQPANAAGSWWTQQTAPYLSAPDVALNHPLRWTRISETSGPLSSVYCLNVLDRSDVQKDGGYQMKGLFVLPEGATSGPQLTVAEEGETLQLQARVYNYSRMDMSAASVSHVKVQFYGQEWDTATQEFAGDAFLIDEVTLDPIPGVNASNPGLASATASASFDTGSCPLGGGCGGKHLKFWLVTWMEDGGGGLVADYQDHGLKRLPETTFTRIGQVPVQPISNNVGYYDQEIYICPQGTQCPTAGAGASTSDASEASLTIDNVSVSADRVATLEPVEVSAILRSGEHSAGPVTVFFFEGDPENGGKAFEVEHIPFLEAGASYLTRVGYQPQASGVRDIFVVAHAGGAAVTGTSQVEVLDATDAAPTCQNPLETASGLSGRVDRIGDTRGRAGARLSAVLPIESELDLSAATVTLDRLAHELGGAGELLKDEHGEAPLPLVLAAGKHSRADRAVFESDRHARPRVRLALHKLDEGRLKVDLRISKATIPEPPQLCGGDTPTTDVMTRLAAIDDGTNPPLTVPIVASWACGSDRHGGVRELVLRFQR